METKANVFLGETGENKGINDCSFNDAEMLSPHVDSSCNDRHQTYTEISHPLSACLRRESFLESAESEETLRDFNISDGIRMNIKPLVNRCGSMKTPVLSDQLEKQKGSECRGDKISLICGSDHSKTKNIFHTGGSSHDEVDDNHMRPNGSTYEFPQVILCCSNKSDLTEIPSLRDSCAGDITTKGERSESSEEQVQSSFARRDALQIGEEHNSAESMQADTGINEKEKTADVASMKVVEEVTMGETTIGSQPAICTDGSDNIEYEVKICDICGDIGREELLAVCSKCNDGAEHIYCMHIKMNSVPKGDWMCEECMLSEEMEKQKQGNKDQGMGIFRKLNTLEAETELSEVEGSKTYEGCSTHLFSSSKAYGGLQAVRKGPFGTVLKPCSTSSSSCKTSIHESGGHSSSTTLRTVCSPTETCNKSPKLSSQYHVLKGKLFKSKSMNLKSDAQLHKERSCSMQGLGKETTAKTWKGRVQMFSRSQSMKTTRSYSVNNCKTGINVHNNFSHSEDLSRSTNEKLQYSTKTAKKLRLAGSDSFPSIADGRIASTGKNSLQHPSSQSYRDLMAAKGNGILDNSLKTSARSAEGSANKEKTRVFSVRQRHPADVLSATRTSHSRTNILPDEQPCVRDFSKIGSSAQKCSWISAVPQLDCIWNGNFEIQSTGGLHFTCDGIQAHLSSYASHKVFEVANKLPQKLSLEEVPRLSMWPTQFIEHLATEDNIALYFFAKDPDSYERSYEKFLERMIKNDFSLKGKFDGVDLLIFSSNLLPEKSRLWKLFLWGVFIGKRVHCSEEVSVMSASENLLPPGRSTKISTSLVSCYAQQTLNSITLLDEQAVKMDEFNKTKISSSEQKPPDTTRSCSREIDRVNDQTKNELFFRADSLQIKERESKGIPEIDLNYCIQERGMEIADEMEGDEKNDLKRLKTLFGTMDVNNSKDTNNRVNQLDSSVSSLELKLGVERITYPYQGNVPPFLMLMGSSSSSSSSSSSRDLQDENSATETSGDAIANPSLALSLALPNSETDKVYKLSSEIEFPKCRGVHATLSLFG